MSDGFTLDARKFNAALDKVAVTLRKDAPDVIRQEARLLLQRAQTGFTPPKTLAQGRAKIRADIYGSKRGGLFQIYSPAIAKATTHSQFVRLFANRSTHKAYLVKLGMFWPSATTDQMETWHKSRLYLSGGRIKVKYPQAHAGKNFVDLNRPAVTRQALEKFITSVQKRVGRLKAGWNLALLAVGGKIQPWAARHKDVEFDYGLVLNGLGNTDYPSITIGNQAPTISRWRKEWQVLLDSRARDMVKRAEFLLKKAKKKGGF